MQISFTDNLQAKLLSALRLDEARISFAQFAIAFIKSSGLKQLEPFFVDSINHGGQIEIIVGLDFRTTDPSALRQLRLLSANANFKYFCFSEPAIDNAPIFHPKLYLLKQADGKNRVAIGSSNLSDGGLKSNIEVNAIFEDLPANEFRRVSDIYKRIRQKETLFVPDEAYIDAYRALFKKIQASTRQALKEEQVSLDIEKLRAHEIRLPGTSPTQVDLIVEALRSLPKNQDGYVRLPEIQKHVRERAHELGIAWEYETLENSIRGRLNTHSVGKNGFDLFDRKIGQGLYKLTAKGSKHVGRKVI